MTDTTDLDRKIGNLAIYTCAAMRAARISDDDIRRAAKISLAGKTANEPSDIDAVVADIRLRGFYLGPDGMVWGIHDERQAPAQDYVLVRLGNPFEQETDR
jgi:hypothetical protein